jgi:feruloyl esterase
MIGSAKPCAAGAARLHSGAALKRLLGAMGLAAGPVAALVGLQGPPAQAQTADAAQRCQAMTHAELPGLEITGAKLVPAAAPGTVLFDPHSPAKIPSATPRYCRVDGVIDRRKGAGGAEFGLRFALALPDDWNGRLLFQGGGAFDGDLYEPYGLFASGDEPSLARGFAVIATDAGHEGAPFDTSFYKDQQAALDFALNSVPTVTRTGKALAAKYFGRAPHHTYAVGCSTGGREGMLAAERYPLLFDGVVSGDPAMRSWNTRIAGWNATVAFNRISPKGADGKLLRLQAFPAEDQKLLQSALAAQCDELDGLKDNMILNLAGCRFDPAALQCKGSKAQDCLSAEQVAALKAAFGETRDSRGDVVYPGFPYDLGAMGEHVGDPNSRLPSSRPGPYDTPPDPSSLDVDAAMKEARADVIEGLTDTAAWTDLGTFYRRGGKIIFYHGASDAWYSLLDTLDYWQRNKKANPDFDSSRFYSIPNMSHCEEGGLERFDLLTPLVDWVEKGAAPGPVPASDWLHKVTRPICPWPQYGRYKGAGDPNDTASFECRAD